MTSSPLTRADILRVLAILADANPNWQKVATSTMPDNWLVLLGDIPRAALLQAAVEYAQTGEYFPSVQKLRALALPRSDTAPEQAWGWCHKCAEHAGPYASDEIRAEVWRVLEAKDPAAAETLRQLGGLSFFHTLDSGDVATSRAHFARAYLANVARAQRDVDVTRAADTLAGRNGSLQLGPRALRDVLPPQLPKTGEAAP